MSHQLSRTLEGMDLLRHKHGAPTPSELPIASLVTAIVEALNEFTECVRYLNTRRSETSLLLDSEAAVQDAIFLMLRPFVHDLTPEAPTEKVASRYVIKDFRSRSRRAIIEAKYVRDRDHGKAISKEIHDDIEMYRSDDHCDHVVFFVYDPNALIADKEALRMQVEVLRTYDGRALQCHLVLKP